MHREIVKWRPELMALCRRHGVTRLEVANVFMKTIVYLHITASVTLAHWRALSRIRASSKKIARLFQSDSFSIR
jgi:hypothetical protein